MTMTSMMLLDLCVNPITSSGEDDTTVKALSKKQSLIRIKRSSTIRKTHDIETAEVIFDNEDTSL